MTAKAIRCFEERFSDEALRFRQITRTFCHKDTFDFVAMFCTSSSYTRSRQLAG